MGWRERLAWTAAAACALVAAAAVSGVIEGGALDPTDPPAPTMRTLDDVDTSWDRALSSTGGCASARYACVLGGAGVLDRETGLVWEQQPSLTASNWHLSLRACQNALSGGRRGWRMPTAEEMRSIFDGTGLPADHPFGTNAAGTYWTATTVSDATTQAYVVFTGAPQNILNAIKDTNDRRVWCVRGGSGYQGY
jgi:hypothetical protein